MASNLRIGVIGASGFIGQHILSLLNTRGHRSVAFTRRHSVTVPGAMESREFRNEGPLVVSDLDAVVNLAGESIIGRWSANKKRKIYRTRIGPTARIVNAVKNSRLSGNGPSVFISASGTGYYGDTGGELVTETGAAGRDFLARVSCAWESEAMELAATGVRVVPLRIGFVIGKDGGAIPMMRPAFRFGLGGVLGSGKQYMSWIHVDDLSRIILGAIENPVADGPLNAVAPEPVTNREFTKAFGRAVGRPALFPVPSFVLRLILGEMSELLLTSSRVASGRLGGHHYVHPTVEGALRQACSR